MNIKHKAYIINNSAYLYLLDFEGNYDYTFYTDNYLVMDTGNIAKEKYSFDEALNEVLKKHYLKPENIVALSAEGTQELINHVDDYELVNIL